MAEIAPMAEWRPFTGKSTTPLQHDIICLHTMVGTLAGSWSFASRAGNPYWHFGIGGGGAIWQCQDLRFRSAANLNGNWRVIPIETEDMGAFFAPWGSSCGNVPWWTSTQIDAIVDLVAWLCVRYNIPPVLIPDTAPGRRGIAYHRQGIDPWRCGSCEMWSSADGKCCPDWRRIQQLTEEVVRRVQQRLNQTPQAEAQKVYFLVIGHIDAAPGGSGKQYLADYVGGTRVHMRNPGERDWFINEIRKNGGGVSTGPNNTPHLWGQPDVDKLSQPGDNQVAGTLAMWAALFNKDDPATVSPAHRIARQAVEPLLDPPCPPEA